MDSSGLLVPVVSAEEMRNFDRMTIEDIGVPGVVLMENAGLKTVLAIDACYGSVAGKRFSVLSGKGNNGGDGFVIARHLLNRGAEVATFMLGSYDQALGDAKTNLDILQNMGHCVSFIDDDCVSVIKTVLSESDIVVDAMLGTGLKSNVRGVFKTVIETLNKSKRNVVSVDIPSGLSSDTGMPLGEAVRAALTVTYGFPKQGFFANGARDFTGRIQVVDIGIPRNITGKVSHKKYLITPESVAPMFVKRRRDAHKGNFGHVLVVAGSKGKTGAASMAAEAAVRAGAGLVTLAVPQSLENVLELKTTEVMTCGLADIDSSLCYDALPAILDLARGKSAVVLGPGLSTSPETKKLVVALVRKLESFMVIDADAINALTPDVLKEAKAPIVITPHPGEMSRLIQVETKEIQRDRLLVLDKVLSSLSVKVILKGYNTLVGSDAVYVNTTGNPGMASGGSGDILAGIIAGFIGQTSCDTLALCSAVYVHGLAGDMAAADVGEIPLIATDILRFLPKAIKKVAIARYKYDRFIFE